MIRNKKILILIIITTLVMTLVIGCSKDKSNNQDPDQKIKSLTVEDLYPLSIGDYWKYAGSGIEFAPFEQKVLFREADRVQLQIVNPGVTLVMIYEFQEGQLAVVYSQEDTFEEENILNKENTMESIILKEPIELGAIWETADDRTFEITDTSAEVETPAGTFTDCVEITSTFTGQNALNKMYYKPSLGLVKQIYRDGEFEVIQELEDYEVATYGVEQ